MNQSKPSCVQYLIELGASQMKHAAFLNIRSHYIGRDAYFYRRANSPIAGLLLDYARLVGTR